MASTADAAGGLEREAAANASAKATATASRPVAFFILLLPSSQQERPTERPPYPEREARQPPASATISRSTPNSVTGTALGVSSAKECALPGWRRGVTCTAKDRWGRCSVRILTCRSNRR